MPWIAHLPRSRACQFLAVAVLAASLAFDAVAQPKPALVKGIDDPGRDPYQQTLLIDVTLTTCGTNAVVCEFPFPVVPTGKRLVITHASVLFELNTTASPYARLSLRAGGAILWLPVPQEQSPSSGIYIVSTPVTFYAEPGYTPLMFLESSGASTNRQLYGTLTGYFISVP
jgi:hypothetical protein